MKAVRFILVLAALLLLAAVPLTSSSADADSEEHVIASDLVLTEDLTYGDNDTVIINDGVTVDVGAYTLTFGQNTKVYILASANISCAEGGSIVAGAGSSLVILGSALKSFTSDVTFTFDGTLVFTQTSAITVDVAFADDSTVLNVAWNTSTLAVTGFKMTQEIDTTDGNISRIIGFSYLEYTGTTYDGEELVSTKTVEVESSDPDSTITITIDYAGTLLDTSDDSSVIVISDLTSVTSSTTYASTGVVNTTVFSGLGPTTVSVATTRMATISTTADSMTVNKSSDAGSQFDMTLSTIEFSANVDIDKLLELMTQGITGTTPDWLQYLRFDAATAVIEDHEYGTSRTLTDLSLTINPNDSEERYLIVEATDGSDVYTLAATKVVIESYALSRDMILDLKTSDSSEMTISLSKTTDGVLAMKADVANVVLDIDSLDLKSLTMLYSRTGTMTIQHLLDNSDKISVDADSLSVDDDGDGAYDTVVGDLSAVLCVNTMNLYTLTANFGTLSASPVLNGTVSTLTVGTTSLYMEVSGSVAETLDFLLSGSHFTSDAHAEVQLTNAGFSLEYPLDNGAVAIQGEVMSMSSPPDATVLLSIDHSYYTGVTSLSGNMSFIGHSLTVGVDTSYTDPEGTLDAELVAMDGSGSFNFDFGTSSTEFSASLNVPWAFSLKYYGIDVDVTSGSAGLSLTHGTLDVEGFDISECGVLQLPFCLISNDFTMGFRFAMETSFLEVAKNGSDVPDISCTDVELSVRDLSVDLKRDSSLGIAMNRISLSYVNSEGKQVEDTLTRLNINKDLSGAEAGKGILEKAMYWVLPVSIAAIIIIIVMLQNLKQYRPELFKVNENSDEDHYGITVPDEDEPADWGDPSEGVPPEDGSAEEGGPGKD